MPKIILCNQETSSTSAYPAPTRPSDKKCSRNPATPIPASSPVTRSLPDTPHIYHRPPPPLLLSLANRVFPCPGGRVRCACSRLSRRRPAAVSSNNYNKLRRVPACLSHTDLHYRSGAFHVSSVSAVSKTSYQTAHTCLHIRVGSYLQRAVVAHRCPSIHGCCIACIYAFVFILCPDKRFVFSRRVCEEMKAIEQRARWT
jgi:hypothetical protein